MHDTRTTSRTRGTPPPHRPPGLGVALTAGAVLAAAGQAGADHAFDVDSAFVIFPGSPGPFGIAGALADAYISPNGHFVSVRGGLDAVTRSTWSAFAPGGAVWRIEGDVLGRVPVGEDVSFLWNFDVNVTGGVVNWAIDGRVFVPEAGGFVGRRSGSIEGDEHVEGIVDFTFANPSSGDDGFYFAALSLTWTGGSPGDTLDISIRDVGVFFGEAAPAPGTIAAIGMVSTAALLRRRRGGNA